MTNENPDLVWTENDYRNGWCGASQIGKPISSLPMPDQPDQPPPPDDLPEDADFVFERELLEYRRDPSTYKSRHAPAVVNKLMEVDERRRAEQREQKQQHGKETPVELLPTHVLQARVRETIIQLNAEGFDLMQMMANGIEHIIASYVPPDHQAAARAKAETMRQTFSRMATGGE